MKSLYARSCQANATIYMTMISMIQSLAIGYFATKLNLKSLFEPKSFEPWLIYFLSALLVTQMIVITWHEYTIGSICFIWPLGYSDSWIPILLGLSEYFVITFALEEHFPYSFAGGRSVPYAFIAFSIYAIIGWLAYRNQYTKVKNNRDMNKDIFPIFRPYMQSTHKLMLGNIFIYIFGFIATAAFAHTYVSIIFLLLGNSTLIVHAIRSNKAYDIVFSPAGQRGDNDKSQRPKQTKQEQMKSRK